MYVRKTQHPPDSDTKRPLCHDRADLQPRQPVPARRFKARRNLPAFCAGMFPDAYALAKTFVHPNSPGGHDRGDVTGLARARAVLPARQGIDLNLEARRAPCAGQKVYRLVFFICAR